MRGDGRMRRRAVLFALGTCGAVGALAAATAVRLRLQSIAEPVGDDVAASKPVDPGPDLAVTGLADEELARRGIARLRLGDLAVRDGRIVAADPLVTPDRPAFERSVSPGTYPVMLYVARGRVALAELRLDAATASRWQIATIPGQDAATLKPEEIYGYPVDAGLGCFMDLAGQTAFARREALERVRVGEGYNGYDDLLAAPLKAAGDREMMFQPLAEDPANVAVFQSGWGDGFYATYWGLDGGDRPLRLVTDFGVLDHGEGREGPPATTSAAH